MHTNEQLTLIREGYHHREGNTLTFAPDTWRCPCGAELALIGRATPCACGRTWHATRDGRVICEVYHEPR